jgi:hypothetical protein
VAGNGQPRSDSYRAPTLRR